MSVTLDFDIDEGWAVAVEGYGTEAAAVFTDSVSGATVTVRGARAALLLRVAADDLDARERAIRPPEPRDPGPMGQEVKAWRRAVGHRPFRGTDARTANQAAEDDAAGRLDEAAARAEREDAA